MNAHFFHEDERPIVALAVGRFVAMAFDSHTLRPYAGRVGRGFEVSVLGFALRVVRPTDGEVFSCGCPVAGGANVYGLPCL